MGWRWCIGLVLAAATVAAAQDPPAPSGRVTYGPWRPCQIGGGGFIQQVVLTLHGDGQAWLDELKVTAPQRVFPE